MVPLADQATGPARRNVELELYMRCSNENMWGDLASEHEAVQGGKVAVPSKARDLFSYLRPVDGLELEKVGYEEPDVEGAVVDLRTLDGKVLCDKVLEILLGQLQ